MSGMPGAGCDDPREIHEHWCGFCGAKKAFARVECQQLVVVPPCPACGERQWKGDVDELTAPDNREQPA